jgi:hypothetical protein
MDEEMGRLANENPQKYASIAARIAPLLAIQKFERARKRVAARIELQKLGVTRLAAPS